MRTEQRAARSLKVALVLLCVIRASAQTAGLSYRWRPAAPASSSALGTLQAGPHLQIALALSIQSAHPAPVRVQIHATAHAIFADIEASQPVISQLTIGPWQTAPGPNATPLRAVRVPVPYDSEAIFYLPDLALFARAGFDWTRSSATALPGDTAIYAPLTNGRRNLLKERVIVSISPNFRDVLPEIPNGRSPYFDQVSGRTVLDFWGGRKFDRIAALLASLGAAGLHDCTIIVHDWQHSGYDVSLPAHIPANAGLGGEDALRRALAAARSLGCYAAVHENYVDTYPDSSLFIPEALARKSNGAPLPSWFNPSTTIQSFATKPTWFLKYAATQSPEIHRRYGTNASFLDVNSSVLPWWRADMQALDDAHPPSRYPAGEFSAFAHAAIDLWRYLSRIHQGPVFGEGSNHWYWSGLLDGVEAQFGAGVVPGNIGSKAPLFVDFDLLRIHPLQVNHGMGYYSRWLAKGESIADTAVLDAYRMQEIAYGHAPYVGDENLENPARVLVEQNLVGPVARRYAPARAASISYQLNGRWVTTETAIQAADWSRVKVTYSNGDTVVANAQPSTLLWNGFNLPQFGWVAQGDGLLAYTALRYGHLVDYAETGASLFANARIAAEADNLLAVAQPLLAIARPLTDRRMVLQFSWHVFAPLATSPDERFKQFIHFTDAAGGIVFQADRSTTVNAARWRPGASFSDDSFTLDIPAAIPDGTYSLRTGLYAIQGGERARLLGWDDGEHRYILGSLVISGHGQTVAFIPQASPLPDPRLNAPGILMDFGTIQTDGMVSISRTANRCTLRAFPAYRVVRIRLNASRFPPPRSVDCAASAPTHDGYWEIDSNGGQPCRWSAR